jgi:uncharacterized protein
MLAPMRSPLRAVLALSLALCAAGGCRRGAARTRAEAEEVIDAHLHLTSDSVVPELLTLLDRHGIARAAVLASPNITRGLPGKGLEGYREGNEIVLRAGAAHPGRLLPFVTFDLAADGPADLQEALRRGACGVKLYQGHPLFHARRLDDPAHLPLLRAMSDRGVPVLLHVNTAHYLDELEGLLRALPDLRVVCAHYGGAKMELDRLVALMDAFPQLQFDTSHGAVSTAVPGLMSLERERERVRAIVERAPDRFLFGSDLVTNAGTRAGGDGWDEQIAMNLGILKDGPFTYWRAQDKAPGLVRGTYRGVALPPGVLDAVLRGNAARWLARCIDRR